MPNLRDKVIAITGGSAGIGAATAIECARAGMHVAISGRRLDALNAVAAKIEALGRRALPMVCDVDKTADVDAFIANTHSHFGRLDAVFANAGYGLFATVLETTDAQMQAIFETNFYGTLRVIKAAAPIMTQQGNGHILICSSAASRIGPPMYGAYAATKAAQHSIATALRAELAGRNIFVTSVHPIGTDTEFFRRVAEVSGLSSGAKSNTPIRFRQSVDHVAHAIVRAMQRQKPPPEVWPSLGARLGLGLVTAFPRIGSWAMRHHRERLRPGK